MRVRPLPWDTEFFGRRVARVEGGALTPALWTEIREECRAASIEALYLLLPAGDIPSIRAAEDAGFRLVDLRMSLEWRRRGPDAPAGPERLATEADLPALRAIARSSHEDSRFFQDPRFRDRAPALFEAWIEKSCRGWADQVWVADVDGRPAGYVTVHQEPDQAARVGLLAVAPAARGRGVGGGLLRRAQRGVERLTTVTQGRNVAAQRLYQNAGFVSAALDLWYHRWMEDAS